MSRKLKRILPKKSGRDAAGHVSVRHQGGRHKRFLRRIDFKRDKLDLPGKVMAFEYDPNRTADIALLTYSDGEKRYILAPQGLKVGDQVVAGPEVEIKVGNTLPLKRIPVGTPIHNVELTPGKGGQIARGAGTAALIQSKEGGLATVKLPSGEIRTLSENCLATLGQLGNLDWKNEVFGKAGRKRLMGIRPTVRGVAQHPDSHPHGGGEGRSGIGLKSPKSPWGKKTLGKKTRQPGRYSDKLIIKRIN
ncbi:50S ribosomal protein L2 [Candidatus Shapirobacteria bacterium CG10_big_fil_rev_8_21_14_0_10_48_15]|uniref:Large ribosomal subunit protein uL2 n=1 Tax=Candidatus Shapirobacteria bacterium CG10_big_fil_rev_8_21_14_0_10_48_15 TaxID=1974484 RepID=A0A2M8L6X7_9BACT|nr:MAG: 50S ribosomal protein L2 [Candidatus Shapirobacteria bacterium CG10_big_fil_rev_8_21_14_0_10_48_15]